MNWREFVRKVQKDNGISYREAQKKASPLWKAQKPKKKGKKTVVKPHEEINEFPKCKTPKPTRRVIASTEAVPLTNIGGSLVPQDHPCKKKRKRRGKQRIRKKHSVVYSTEAKFLARKARV